MPLTDTALAVPGLLGRVLDWVRVHSTPGSNFADFSREELRQMAADLSLANSELRELATHARDNTPLMEGMMRARGLDPDHLRHAFVTFLRDVERVCSLCKHTGRCRRELEAGTAAEHSHEFCPNALSFDDVIEYNMGR